MTLSLPRKAFYDQLRGSLFRPRLTARQVAGMEVILDQGIPNPHWIAYILATVYHETSTAMWPIMETQRPHEKTISEDTAIARLESSWKRGRLPWVSNPYWRRDADGKSWLGRGLIQVTHKMNYEKIQKKTGIKCVVNPAMMLELGPAVKATICGMSFGWFTGHSLEDYFRPDRTWPVEARQIVNGNDRAKLIAGYYEEFYSALGAIA